MTRRSLGTLSLLASLVCFAVAFLLASGILHGSDLQTWKTAGAVGLVLGLILGRSG